MTDEERISFNIGTKQSCKAGADYDRDLENNFNSRENESNNS